MREPPRIPLAQLPTPLQRLDRLSRDLGRNIWVKRDDLTHHSCSGNKIRKLEYLLAEAVNAGATHVITAGAVQSNHCRATAIAASSLGLQSELILRGAQPATSEGNLLLSELVGAHCHFVDRETWRQLPDVFQLLETSLRGQSQTPYSIPIGGSNPLGVWGYARMMGELKQDLKDAGIEAAHVVSAVGSGGTYAGILAGIGIHELTHRCSTTGILVSDDKAYFDEKVSSDLARWTADYENSADLPSANFDDRFIAPGYGRANPEIFQLIHSLAKQEGLFLDPVYSGKAFFGMLQRMKEGLIEEDDVVFVHTGGLFGLMAQSDGLARELSTSV
jgi:D-cysteine desulfhydrase